MKLKPGVFIIESLELKEEDKGKFEGKILTEMLNMLGVKAKYVYIRTQEELKVMIKKFEKSNFKYLHISCHGNDEGIAMTLDDYSFPFSEFSDMFEYYGEDKRLFFSACSVMNGNTIVDELLQDTKFLSITGPSNDIEFADSAIFWASFYHLMFSEQGVSMDSKYMLDTIEKLNSTFNVKMGTVISKKSGSYNRYEGNKKCN